jgi:hypothetical protein
MCHTPIHRSPEPDVTEGNLQRMTTFIIGTVFRHFGLID